MSRQYLIRVAWDVVTGKPSDVLLLFKQRGLGVTAMTGVGCAPGGPLEVTLIYELIDPPLTPAEVGRLSREIAACLGQQQASTTLAVVEDLRS